MPQYKNNILVVTKDELLSAKDENGNPFFGNWECLRKTIYRYENKTYGIKRIGRGGGKGNPVYISFDSLSSEMQDAIGDPRKREHILMQFFEIDNDAIEFFNRFRTKNGSLEDEKKREYVTNASLLTAGVRLIEARLIEWNSKGKTSVRNLYPTVCNDLLSFKPILKKRFQRDFSLPESPKRLIEKLRQYQSLEGDKRYEYLVNGQYGNKNATIKTERQKSLLESMFMSQKHKPTPTEVAKQYDAFLSGYVEVISCNTGEVYDPKEFGKLGLSTITSYLAEWQSKIATYNKRAGNRQQFISNFIPYASMLQPEYAGSIISVDDRNPPFWYAKGKRMWFYCAYDIGSGAFTTWVYGKSKEGIISDFYRQMVRNYAEWGMRLPAEIECESSLNSTFRETLLSEGAMFRYVRIEANKARGKYIERVWEMQRYGKEKEREGWLARPNSLRESNQKSDEDIPIIPYEEIANNCLEDIVNWNNSAHPNQEKYPGKTRWEVFLENQHPDLKPINWSMILPYIGYKTETSCKAGTIKLQRKEFFLGLNGKISTGEELISLMELVEGKELDVYWLDGNNGEVLRALVYQRGGNHMVCEAHIKPTFHRAKIEQTAQDRENMSLVMSYIQTINGYISRRKSEIEKVLVIDHRDATLNQKFTIPGINTGRYNVDPLEEVETLPEPGMETATLKLKPVEVLETPEESFKIDSKEFQMIDKRGLISRMTSSNY
ncbi:hypothetical protein HMPREF1214_04171 [Bacteroides sp. HPS0048]|uniref:hypothetical protein n=1 Tax=Bacteroides sp. HPS0048 TaxID=1078089 RepID=UPI0003717E77|nr:hypothetical protein [Bacteroides sp. HPS0048]EOA54207.1 hypothetical protein HMPREF1214_04171 [Bacteroides sp. HPS0048]